MRLPDSLGGRLGRAVAWSLAGSVALQAATLAGAILTARILGQQAFGELSLVRSTVLMLAAMAGGGLSLAATTHVAERRDRDPVGAGRVIGLLSNAALAAGTLVLLAGWAFARPLAAWLSPEAGLETALRIGALLPILAAVGGVISGSLAGLEAFRATARLMLLDAGLGLLLVPSGAWLAGVSGAMGGGVVAALGALPFKQAALRRHHSASGIAVARRHGLGEWLALRRFALPATLLGFSVQPFEWLARVELARQAGGLAQLGLFAAAFSWGTAVLFLPSQVSGPALPILAHTAAAGEGSRSKGLLRSLALLTGGLAAAVALPVALLAGPIMAAYGPGFTGGAPVLRLVLVAYCVASFSGLFRAILASAGRMWWQLLHAVIWGGTLLGVFGIVWVEGARGLAVSYLVAYVVVLVTQGISVRAVWGRAGSLGSSTEG